MMDADVTRYGSNPMLVGTGHDHDQNCGLEMNNVDKKSTDIENANSSSVSSSNETLSMFLKQKRSDSMYLLELCGGLHYSWSDVCPVSRFVVAWRWTQYLSLLWFMYSLVKNFSFSTAKETRSFWVIVIVVYYLQVFIGFPIRRHAARRLQKPVTDYDKAALPTVMSTCKWFIALCWIIAVASLFVVNVGVIIVIQCAFVLPLLSISTWGLFLILLDAEGSRLHLVDLLLRCRDRTLTMEIYHGVYRSLVADTGNSMMLDYVGALSYTCITTVSLLITFGTPPVSLVLFTVGLLLPREVLMLWFILPPLAEANEAYNELCVLLATEKEWTTADGETSTMLWKIATQRPLSLLILGSKVERNHIIIHLGSFAVAAGVPIVQKLIVEQMQ